MSSAAWKTGMPRRISSPKPAAEAKLTDPSAQRQLPAPVAATRLSSRLRRLPVSLPCRLHKAFCRTPWATNHRRMHCQLMKLSTWQQVACTKQALLTIYQMMAMTMKQVNTPYTERMQGLWQSIGSSTVRNCGCRKAWLSMDKGLVSCHQHHQVTRQSMSGRAVCRHIRTIFTCLSRMLGRMPLKE